MAAISAYSKHKATALDFLKFLTSPAEQKTNMEKGSLAPVIESIYTDPALVSKYPYLPVLLTSIKNAVSRPGHAVLPWDHQRHPGERLRGHPRFEDTAASRQGHAGGHVSAASGG